MQTGGTDAAFEFQTLERAWETLTGETVKDPLEQHIPTQLGVKAVVPLSTNVYDRCKGMCRNLLYSTKLMSVKSNFKIDKSTLSLKSVI